MDSRIEDIVGLLVKKKTMTVMMTDDGRRISRYGVFNTTAGTRSLGQP
jgi:hypothetical protein